MAEENGHARDDSWMLIAAGTCALVLAFAWISEQGAEPSAFGGTLITLGLLGAVVFTLGWILRRIFGRRITVTRTRPGRWMLWTSAVFATLSGLMMWGFYAFPNEHQLGSAVGFFLFCGLAALFFGLWIIFAVLRSVARAAVRAAKEE